MLSQTELSIQPLGFGLRYSVLEAVDVDRLREHAFDPETFEPGTLDG